MLDVIPAGCFRRDARRMEKRGKNLDAMKAVIKLLREPKILPPENRDHALDGQRGLRDCHIAPDWILLYRYNADKTALYLERTGTHSDIFG